LAVEGTQANSGKWLKCISAYTSSKTTCVVWDAVFEQDGREL